MILTDVRGLFRLAESLREVMLRALTTPLQQGGHILRLASVD